MFQDLVLLLGLDLIPNPFSRGEGAKSPSPLERDFPKRIPLERVRSNAENKKRNMTK